VLVARLSGRRVCVECGAVYQIDSSRPSVEGVCDRCGGKVIQRDDDKPEAIARRLALFDEQTAPLLDYYADQGKLTRVDGNRSVDVVQSGILEVIQQRIANAGAR
jgi:adenylate kinase